MSGADGSVKPGKIKYYGVSIENMHQNRITTLFLP